VDIATADPFSEVWLRLRRAHARFEESPPYSPDWAAAVAELEDIARQVRRTDLSKVEVPFGIRKDAALPAPRLVCA
jgi:hypothetical protein